MPTEVSVAKPLSGTEALDSVLYELRRLLSRDGRFQSHMAYQAFRAVLDFKFYPAVGFTPPVERSLEITQGDQSDVEEIPTVEEHLEIPVRPPNQVREEAEMPTPVLVTDALGKTEEKWVKRGPGRPRKNVVMGGVQ